MLVPAALAGLSAALARRRPRFAPQVLRDEGMLAILVLALAVAVLPRILDGWRSAATMNAVAAPAASTVSPMWTWMVVGGTSVLGALYTLWSRR